MKFKTIAAFALVLVMLGTVAAPVFAGKPIKPTMATNELKQPPEATADCALQVTHDNHIKVTIVLDGAAPSNDAPPGESAYYLWLRDDSGGANLYALGNFWTDSNGKARFTAATNGTLDGMAERTISLFVNRVGEWDLSLNCFSVTIQYVPFKV